jgi:hypothetical protein
MAVALATHVGACGESSSFRGGPSTGLDGFCSMLSGYAQQCGELNQCEQELVHGCTAYAPHLATAYTLAAESCSASCSESGASTRNECLFQAQLSVKTTPIQQRVQSDFCNGCPDGASAAYGTACSQFYQGEDGSLGFGGPLLLLDDSIAGEVDEQCAATLVPPSDSEAPDSGPPMDCAQVFTACASRIIGPTLPAACAQFGNVPTDGGVAAGGDAAGGDL